MALSNKRFGILMFLLAVAGGVFALVGQQDRASLTADISQVVDQKSKPDKEEKEDKTDKEEEEEEESFEDSLEQSPQVTPEPQPQPQPQPQPSPIPVGSQKVSVWPTSVPAGGNIIVTVDTSDVSAYILFVDVSLKSTKSGDVLQGSIVSIDGAGNRFGSLTIPSGAEQGSWVVKKVSIVDATGNTTSYHDGPDISIPFTVTSP